MSLISTHAFAELPEEFYTLQDWQGFDNPKIVVLKTMLMKNEARHAGYRPSRTLKYF